VGDRGLEPLTSTV